MSDQEEFDDLEMDVDLSQAGADDDVDELSDGDDDDDDDSGDSEIDAEVQLYEKYAELLAQISADSYNYDNYVQLVELAHQLSDLDKLRESCELFSRHFPLAPDIWTNWLQIELSIATTESELTHLHALLKKALADYFSVAIGGLHAQVASKLPNAPEIWDEVLETYGYDCMEGSTFFRDWRTYYTKHVPESPEKVKKLLEVFTHELSLPLAGIQDTYTVFCEFVDKHDLTVDWEKINETYHKAKENLLVMLKFEEELVSLDEKEHHKRAAIYSDYIEKCKTFLPDRMVQILYERLVTACCLNASCWMKYVKYLRNREPIPNKHELPQVFRQDPWDVLQRSLRNCTWSADLYIEEIRWKEKMDVPVMSTVNRALEATTSDVKGFLNVWLEYLSYFKRKTDITSEKDVETLRKTMELGIESLAERSADAFSEFDRLCAHIEYSFLKNGDSGYQHYDNVIKNFNNQNKAALWIEFAHLDLNRGVDAARRIFRRAIKVKNIDDFDLVMASWKSFEYLHGTADQIRDCFDICEKIIENYNKHVAIKAKAQKRKQDTEGDGKIVEKKQKTKDESFARPVKNPFETKKVENKTKGPVQSEASTSQKQAQNQTQAQTKAQTPEQEYGEKDDVSIFLSNLSFDAKKEDIISAFPELNIKDVTLIVAPTGRGKGYGYAELGNPSEVEKALKFDRRPIGGRPVFISKVLRDKTVRPALKYSEGKELNKIFIKGLPFDTTKDELQILFSAYGKIKDIRLPTKKDGKFKGIAFIDYETDASANKAVEAMHSYVLRGMTLNVAISNPPPKGEAPRPTTNLKSNTLPGFRGEAKPRLSFIPTSVQRNVLHPPAAASKATNGEKPTTSKSNDYFRQFLNKK